MIECSNRCGCNTHTHTHKHFMEERRKLLYNFFLFIWSKGGSREQLEVSILPRDLV